MSASDTSKGKKHRLGGKWICAIALYIVTIIVLIFLLYSFKEDRPQIEEININHTPPSLEISGKNLDSNIRATALHHDSRCSNIVAKKFMWERVFDVKVKGSIAWALCRGVGLIALDISNPYQPEILHTIHINKFLWHLKIVGDTAYIACGKDGVVMCDITSPAEAKTIYVHNLPGSTTDVSMAQNLLYVSKAKEGISVIDPEAEEVVYHLNEPGTVMRLHATESRLFTLSKESEHGLLHIYSIDENPAQPKLLQRLQFSGSPRDYILKGNRLFLANGNAGIGMVELHENKAATYTVALNPPLRSNRLAMFGKKLAVFGRAGNIALYSFSGDGKLILSSSANSCSRIYGAGIFDHYAIIAANFSGINIVDLSMLRKHKSAHLVAQLPLHHESMNWKTGLHGIAVRDGETLHYLKSLPDGNLKPTGELKYPSSQFFHGYNIYNSRIYAAIKNDGLHVARITADGAIHPGETIALHKRQKIRVHAIEGYKDNLYLCTNDGLKVFDISNPDHPAYQPEQDIPGDIRSITFGGGFAYISSYGEGIKIGRINNENKLGPTETINFPQHLIPEGKSLDIIYADGFLFAACGYRGLLYIDVRNPNHPVVLDSIELPGYSVRLELNHGILGVKSFDSVYLFDAENLQNLRMLGNVDNVKDFHLGDAEVLYLQKEGILRTPHPKALKLTQSSSTKLIFRLPADNHIGSYNLFLSLNDKRSKHIGSLVNTSGEAMTSGWKFIQNQIVE